jgi:MFS family permease
VANSNGRARWRRAAVTDDPSPTGSAATGDGAPERLWHNRDFVKLWSGETFSQFGNQITIVVLPLIAVITLDAGADAVGLLAATQYAPILLVSLFAGIWLDNHRRRPVLVASYLGRALLLALIPVLYVMDLLTLAPLFVIAFAAGLCTAVSDVAYISYLPQLVTRRQLVSANARIETSYSVAEIGGPALGGVLAQALTAPVAVLSSVIGNLIASVLNLRIRHAESPPRPAGERETPWTSIRHGMRATLAHPIFRPLVLQAAAFNLFATVVVALFLLYGVRFLHLPSSTLGIILSTASVGGLVGTIVAARVANRLGMGRTLVLSMVVASLPLGLVPATSGTGSLVVITLVAGLWLHGLGQGIFNVHTLSIRALLSPPETLGRVTATYRFISTGTLPLGGLLAAGLGATVGARAAMAISVGLLTACCALFALTTVRRFTVTEEMLAG